MREKISGRSFHEPPVHWNHRLTLRLTTIPPLLGERAGLPAVASAKEGVRADVFCSRRDSLPPRFMVREQFPSEQATAHEPWDFRQGGTGFQPVIFPFQGAFFTVGAWKTTS
jgi:hypothetical protein